MTTMADARLVSADLLREELSADGGSSALRTAARVLSPAPGSEIGLWEAGPGTDVDVEADELFLVLAGQGRVSFEDGSSLGLRPGVLVRLHRGDRTTWEITERVRKLYLA